jgi:ATP-dependent exoDNAse (exonuclease V) beta subunit
MRLVATVNYEQLMATLNDEQRQAVESVEDVVVLAGPGSGKTDTITAKVARLCWMWCPHLRAWLA